ncbi:MAG: hypothetical protein JSU87_07220, partial [Gemmatimonadota bacterium]
MLRTVTLGITAGLGLTLLQACEDSTPASPEPSFRFPAPQTSSDKKLDVGVCAPGQGEFSLVSTNPYFPIDVGRQWYLEGEEDDEAIELLITVLDETELVAGVTTRVVEEREWVDGELIEV